MARATKARPRAARTVTASEQSRIDAERALRAAVKRERSIQRLARQLDRERERSAVGLYALSTKIAEWADVTTLAERLAERQLG